MSFTPPNPAYPTRGSSAAATRIIPAAALLRSSKRHPTPHISPPHGPVTVTPLAPSILPLSTSPVSSVPASPNHKPKKLGATSAIIPQDILASKRRPSLASSEVSRGEDAAVVVEDDGGVSTPDGMLNPSSVDSQLNPIIMYATFDQELQSFHTRDNSHDLYQRRTHLSSFHSSPSETPPHSFTPVERMSPVTVSTALGTSVPTSVGSSQTNSNMSSTASSSPSSPQSTSKRPGHPSSSSSSSTSHSRGTSNKPSNRVRGTKAPPAAAYANRSAASDNTSMSTTTTNAASTGGGGGGPGHNHQRSLTDGQGTMLTSSVSAASLLHHQSRPQLQQLLLHSPTGASIAMSPSSFTQPPAPLHHGGSANVSSAGTATNQSSNGNPRSGLHSPISPQSPACSSPALRRAHSHTSSTLMFPHIGTLNSPVRTPTRTPSPAITSMGGIANGGKLIVPQTISVPSGFAVVAKEMDSTTSAPTSSSSSIAGSPAYSFTNKKKSSAFVFPSSASFNALSSPTHSASTSNLASPIGTPAKSSVEASLKRRMSLNAPLPLQVTHSASAHHLHHLHQHAHHLHPHAHHLVSGSSASSFSASNNLSQTQQQQQPNQPVQVHREEQEGTSPPQHLHSLEPIPSPSVIAAHTNEQALAQPSTHTPHPHVHHHPSSRSSLVTREKEDLLHPSLSSNHNHSHGSHHQHGTQQTPLLSPLERRPSLAHASVTASPASASPANGNSPRVSRIREDTLSVANATNSNTSLWPLNPLSLQSPSHSTANSPSIPPLGTYYSESGGSSIMSSKIGSMVSPAISAVDHAAATSQPAQTERYDALLPSAAVVAASAAHCIVSSFPLYVSAKKKRSYSSHITYCEVGGLMKDNTVGAPTAANALRSPTAAAAVAADSYHNPSFQSLDASQLRANAIASSLIDTSSNYTFSPQRYTQLFKSHFQKKSHQAVFGLFSGFNAPTPSEPVAIDAGVFFAQYFQQHFLTYLDLHFPDVTALTAGVNSNPSNNGVEATVDLRPYLKHATQLCIDAMQVELVAKLSALQHAQSMGGVGAVEPEAPEAPNSRSSPPVASAVEGSGCAFVIALISGGVLYMYNSNFTVGNSANDTRETTMPSFQALLSRGSLNHLDLNDHHEKTGLSSRLLEKEDRFMVLSSVPLLLSNSSTHTHSADPVVSGGGAAAAMHAIETAASAQEAVNRVVEHRRSAVVSSQTTKNTTDEKLLLSIVYF